MSDTQLIIQDKLVLALTVKYSCNGQTAQKYCAGSLSPEIFYFSLIPPKLVALSTCTTVYHEVIPIFFQQKLCWPFGYHLPAIYLQLWHIFRQMSLLFSPGGLWSLFIACLANPKYFLALPVHAGHNEFSPTLNKSLLQNPFLLF